MLDTVILKISKEHFDITKTAHLSFSQPITSILDENIRPGYLMSAYYTPNQELKALGIYLPKFSLYKAARSDGYEIFGKVEFSAPKLLFGNNFDELTDDDLESVCRALSGRLRLMGIRVHPLSIRITAVTAIHYGKNIPFTDYTTASQIIRDLSKCDTTIRKRYNQRDFVNNGEALYLHTKADGLVIYDKKQELQNTRSYANSRFEEENDCQFYLLDCFNQKPPFEVARVEARLLKRRAIKTALTRCSVNGNGYKFCDLFSSEIAKTVLLNAFAPFESEQNKLIYCQDASERLAIALRANNQELSPKDILMIVGCKDLLETSGYRDIRKLLGATSGQWSRIKRTIANVNMNVNSQNSITVMKQRLEEFEPVRLKDYGLDK